MSTLTHQLSGRAVSLGAVSAPRRAASSSRGDDQDHTAVEILPEAGDLYLPGLNRITPSYAEAMQLKSSCLKVRKSKEKQIEKKKNIFECIGICLLGF